MPALLLVLPLLLLLLLLPLLPTLPGAVAGLQRSSFNLTWLIKVGGCGLGKAWESRRPVLILSSVLAVPFMLLLLFSASLGPAMLPAPWLSNSRDRHALQRVTVLISRAGSLAV
jgi:hypothetical protein